MYLKAREKLILLCYRRRSWKYIRREVSIEAIFKTKF